MKIEEEERLLNSQKTLAELEKIGADEVQELFRKITDIDIIVVGKNEDDVFEVAVDYGDYTMSLDWEALTKKGYIVRTILHLYQKSYHEFGGM